MSQAFTFAKKFKKDRIIFERKDNLLTEGQALLVVL